MMTFFHVILALSSLGLATYNFTSPSKTKLNAAYGLAGGTLASGTALIFLNNASVLRTCLTGIAFFGIVSILNELARHKLAHQYKDI